MPKRVLKGKVLSNSGTKSVVVEVARRFRDPLYKKTLIRTKNYHVHDEKEKYQVNDIVEIIECRPISKTKRFEVIY